MFLRKPCLRRLIASWLLVQTSTQLLWPTISYALTAGPTAPEATSFEPVDTTDMVNLISGDLTYNIPLLEVPGPEGGYPLSLAYHAGIQPDIEASWVGLGWSLNPGAITRNVNGYADDYNDVAQVTRDYWAGGATETNRVGIGVGIPGNVASVSAGLSFSHDTYKGYATGVYAGVTVGIGGEKSPLGVSASVSADGYGNASASAGIGVGTKGAVSMGASIGASTNFNSISVNAGAGISAAHNSLLGASISSGGGHFSFNSQAGPGSVHNDHAGRIQTEATGLTLDIPIGPVFLEYGYSYTRYWSDETSIVKTNGALYFPSTPSAADVTNNAYDTYRLLDLKQNIVTNPDPDKVMGGSFAEYDNYNVTAQGLSGSFRPYSFQQPLYSRNRLDQDGSTITIQDLPLTSNNVTGKLGFRFESDFANQYRQENGSMDNGYAGNNYSFDPAPVHGTSSGTGYDGASGRLAGSKHIEWYTNKDIINKNAAGFIDTDALGFSRTSDNQIGGFSITNTSGVTYHYALPAYSFDEVVYSELLNKEDGTSYPTGYKYNRLKKAARYAYTWYLTAMTGPDYIDRNANGLVDVGDWGYWVKMGYGKWSDRFGWRNPAQGFRKDIDSNVRTYSKGTKEVYYLNSVATRTHTALFEKEMRYDYKSSTLYDKEIGTDGSSIVPDTQNKGFDVDNSTINTCGPLYSPGRGQTPLRDLTITKIATYPCSSLKLASIIVLNNDDVPANISSSSSVYNISNPANPPSTTVDATNDLGENYKITRASKTIQSQLGQNVTDQSDIDLVRTTLMQKSIRSIKFNYDYSLVPGTPNSYDNFGSSTGKLTLKSLSFLGVAGNNGMPSTKFSYAEEQSSIKSLSINFVSKDNANATGIISVTSGIAPLVGDILLCHNAGENDSYYCTILTKDTANGNYSVGMLSSSMPTSNTYTAVTTKNPPYSTENHDWWGMFKSDFNQNLVGTSESVGRKTTSVSDKAVDVWSLRTITSPLGSNVSIAYEGDQYRKPVLYHPDMFLKIAQEQSTHSNNTGSATILKTPYSLLQEQAFLKVGDELAFTGIVGTVTKITAYTNVNPSGPPVPQPSAWEYKYSLVRNAKVSVNALKDREIDINDLDGRLSTYPCAIDAYNGSCTGYRYNSFIADGYISLPHKDQLQYGGGLRVASVSITTGGETRKTSYKYDGITSANTSLTTLPSGVTSYEPGSIFKIDDANSQNIGGVPDSLRDHYKVAYMRSLPSLLAVAREIPAPGVMYEGVRVQESINRVGSAELPIPGFWTYHFSVFDPSMIGLNQGDASTPNSTLITRRVSIKDMTSRIGIMRSMTHWAAPGRKISETINHYLHDDLPASPNDATIQGASNYQNQLAAFNYQGVIQESFGDSRKVMKEDNSGYIQNVVMSKRDVYPTVLTSTTTTDYLKGITSTSQTLGFDFFSGAPTKTVATDGYGNRFLTETVPAYQYYPEMGLKLGALQNKHMLTQVATTTTYKVDANNTHLAVVAASAQTWSKQVPVIGLTDNDPEAIGTQSDSHIWRPWQSYSWMPTGTTADGLTPVMGSNSFVGYDYNSPTPAASWRLTSQVTLYNAYSNALEAKDMQNVYLATKMGFNQSKVLVSGGPAAYQELAYSGAEEPKNIGEYFSGGVSVAWEPDNSGGGTVGGPWGTGNVERNIDSRYVHTGKASLRIGSYKHGFSYIMNASTSDPTKFHLDPTKAYRASVWANDAAGQLYYWLDGTYSPLVSGIVQKRTPGGWYLLDLYIPPVGPNHTTLRIGCYNSDGSKSIYFDDFRVQPINAQATSYVYDPLTGQVSDMLDNNNLATHYDYTSDGKLKRISRETFQYGAKKVAEYSAHLVGALDATSLDMSFGLATVNVSELAEPAQITYDLSHGTGYRSLTTTNRPYTFSVPSGQAPVWIKVRVRDSQGNVRELAKRTL